MKNHSDYKSYLRNDRSTWLTVAAILSGCALGASAATITESGAAPSGNILTSQMTDLGPGTQDNNRDYANNLGPAGQTFQVGSSGTMGSVSILGRADSAGSWTTGPQPFDGTEVWAIQIGLVNTGTGAISVLDSETATGFAAGANIADYLTFTLANPVSLSAGLTYEWSIDINSAGATPSGGENAWFGFAHSAADAYASGTAINNNTSISNPGGNNGGKVEVTFGGFAAPDPNNYDYVFAIQSVPEPTTLALAGLGGLGLLAAKRRRRA